MRQILKSATLAVAILAIGFGAQSCNTTKMVDKSKLTGHWVLETLDGKDVKTAYPGLTATMQFDLENNGVSGTNGCNNYTGAFTLSDKSEFSALHLASTMKMCMDMSLENDFSKIMGTPAMVLSVDEAGVLHFSQKKKDLLTFKIGEKPTLGLLPVNATTLSGEWKLVNIEGGALEALFGDRVPTMTVTDDGKISGFAGCNRFNTTFDVAGENVTFNQAITTRMACDHLEGESKFIALLTGATQKATIIGNKLTLSNDKGVIVLEFAK